MYCLSLHALALDRQVMEAVWPNNMALGQIWAENIRRAEGNRGFTIWRWEVNKRQVTPNTQPQNITTKIPLSGTSSSGVMSQRQICPSWQPVMMVLKSSITSRLLMQWVGAMRPHSTMGRTKLFPDMMLMCLEVRERQTERETQRDKIRQSGRERSK